MKPIQQKDGGFVVEKGNTKVTFYNGTDRYPILPVRIIYEGTTYPVHKYNIIRLFKAFESTYSEEQVLEVIMDAIE